MDAGGYDLTNLSAPDTDLEAATKKYVDDEIAGVSLETVYPVGSIYISTVSTNPNTLFGFGTWAAFGTGRVLIGINASDADFDTVEETGGTKTVQSAGTNAAPTFTGTASYTVVNHVHQVTAYVGTTDGTYGTFDSSSNSPGTAKTLTTGNPTANGSATYTTAGTISAPAFTGTNTSVVQPYIVVYMWERTA
jgi:hypothetical protein